MQFRHVIEIHAIQSDDKAEWHEDSGDHCQCSHDFVCTITELRVVEVTQIGTGLTIDFQDVNQVSHVVVTVTQVDLSV